MTDLELLAPAKTADIGIEAIRHGADAVYIGAPQFGARAAAGNDLSDLERLVGFAHPFGARVYVTLNTLLYDSELRDAEALVRQLYDIGIDALIVQDLSLLKMERPPIPLHASTQMDNRSSAQIAWLQRQGFEQVVMPREMSIADIRQVHAQFPTLRLETFVHGALCVSLSGRCYASEACFQRSANRGECAQLCRMAYDLEDSDGRKLVSDKHLLSLKDLCMLDQLEALALAGACSFKIEGRLKGMSYVKNVTAAYHQALNRVVKTHPDQFRRASRGEVELLFQPDVRKSFNRGFTHYFYLGHDDDIASTATPKAVGEPVGRVQHILRDSLTVQRKTTFANGDGLCYLDPKGQLQGLRVNRAEGNHLFPAQRSAMHGLQPGTPLFRNFDKAFEDLLQRPSAQRFLPLDITLESPQEGQFRLTATAAGHTQSKTFEFAAELGRTPQHDNLLRQLSKLGNTIFRLRQLSTPRLRNYFIPSSLLAQWRRETLQLLEQEMRPEPFLAPSGTPQEAAPDAAWRESMTVPVANRLARQVCDEQQLPGAFTAYEISHDPATPLMTCRHCIRRTLGICPRQTGRPAPDPLFLRLANGTRFRLAFDCSKCLMQLFLD